MKTPIKSFVFLILIATAQAGPFGFQYGMTVEDIKKSGIKLEKSKTVPAEYKATNLPKEYKDWNSSVLVGITKKYGLVQIQVTKKLENNGKKNLASKDFYDRYKEALKTKYGNSNSTNQINAEKNSYSSRWNTWAFTDREDKLETIRLTLKANTSLKKPWDLVTLTYEFSDNEEFWLESRALLKQKELGREPINLEDL
jgi:hypothetical protein